MEDFTFEDLMFISTSLANYNGNLYDELRGLKEHKKTSKPVYASTSPLTPFHQIEISGEERDLLIESEIKYLYSKIEFNDQLQIKVLKIAESKIE